MDIPGSMSIIPMHLTDTAIKVAVFFDSLSAEEQKPLDYEGIVKGMPDLSQSAIEAFKGMSYLEKLRILPATLSSEEKFQEAYKMRAKELDGKYFK